MYISFNSSERDKYSSAEKLINLTNFTKLRHFFLPTTRTARTNDVITLLVTQ